MVTKMTWYENVKFDFSIPVGFYCCGGCSVWGAPSSDDGLPAGRSIICGSFALGCWASPWWISIVTLIAPSINRIFAPSILECAISALDSGFALLY